MQPTPYVVIQGGKCAEAIAFYADVFGGEVTLHMSATDMPEEFEVPSARKNWVMHSEVTLGDGKLMVSDDIFDMAKEMSGCSVLMELTTTEEAKSAFNKLADGGEIGMAFEPTFWSAGFGTVTDKFGTKWMVGSAEAP